MFVEVRGHERVRRVMMRSAEESIIAPDEAGRLNRVGDAGAGASSFSIFPWPCISLSSLADGVIFCGWSVSWQRPPAVAAREHAGED